MATQPYGRNTELHIEEPGRHSDACETDIADPQRVSALCGATANHARSPEPRGPPERTGRPKPGTRPPYANAIVDIFRCVEDSLVENPHLLIDLATQQPERRNGVVDSVHFGLGPLIVIEPPLHLLEGHVPSQLVSERWEPIHGQLQSASWIDQTWHNAAPARIPQGDQSSARSLHQAPPRPSRSRRYTGRERCGTLYSEIPSCRSFCRGVSASRYLESHRPACEGCRAIHRSSRYRLPKSHRADQLSPDATDSGCILRAWSLSSTTRR